MSGGRSWPNCFAEKGSFRVMTFDPSLRKTETPVAIAPSKVRVLVNIPYSITGVLSLLALPSFRLSRLHHDGDPLRSRSSRCTPKLTEQHL